MNLFFSDIEETDVTQQQTGVNRDMPFFLRPPASPPLLVVLPTVVPAPVPPTAPIYYCYLLPLNCRALQQQTAQPIPLPPPPPLAQQPLQLQSMKTENATSFVDFTFDLF